MFPSASRIIAAEGEDLEALVRTAIGARPIRIFLYLVIATLLVDVYCSVDGYGCSRRNLGELSGNRFFKEVGAV